MATKDDIATKEGLATLTTKVEAAATKEDIATLATKDDFYELGKTVAELNGSVSELRTTVSSLRTAVTSMTSATDSLRTAFASGIPVSEPGVELASTVGASVGGSVGETLLQESDSPIITIPKR